MTLLEKQELEVADGFSAFWTQSLFSHWFSHIIEADALSLLKLSELNGFALHVSV